MTISRLSINRNSCITFFKFYIFPVEGFPVLVMALLAAIKYGLILQFWSAAFVVGHHSKPPIWSAEPRLLLSISLGKALSAAKNLNEDDFPAPSRILSRPMVAPANPPPSPLLHLRALSWLCHLSPRRPLPPGKKKKKKLQKQKRKIGYIYLIMCSNKEVIFNNKCFPWAYLPHFPPKFVKLQYGLCL